MYSIYGYKCVVHQGKVYDYLGISYDFFEKVKVNIDIIPLLEKVLWLGGS